MLVELIMLGLLPRPNRGYDTYISIDYKKKPCYKPQSSLDEGRLRRQS